MRILAGYAVIVLGALLALAGLYFPWHQIPTFLSASGELTLSSPQNTLFGKVLVALLYVIGVGLILLGLFRRKKSEFLVSGLMVICFIFPLLLWFPQWVVFYSGDYSGNAAWSQQQHDSLIWMGGDVYRAHSERAAEGGITISAQDPPFRLGGVRYPPASPLSVGFTELTDLLWWLGYSPIFQQFVKKGWFLSTLGWGFISFGTFSLMRIFASRAIFRKFVRRVALAILISACFIGVASTTPIFLAGQAIKRAKNATYQGQYKEAISELHLAQKIMPPLLYDTGFIFQFGYLHQLLNQNRTPEALLYKSWQLERGKYELQARGVLDIMMTEYDSYPRHIQRELSRFLIRRAVVDINSSQFGIAKKTLKSVCERETTAILPRFHLQLVALQSGDIIESRRMQREIETIYQHYQQKQKRGVISASYWMLSQAELAAGNINEAARARMASKGVK